MNIDDFDCEKAICRLRQICITHSNPKVRAMYAENKRLKTENKRLKTELETIQKTIILSQDNAFRTGRPPINHQVITEIKELRQKGYTERKIAEMLGISNGAVHKYLKNNTDIGTTNYFQ